ncbi:MAG: peptide chain release factor N(5)-glutamine methyltransferase [Candidatus Omnitrophota bacterium]|nr:peptide chain release factor N(5)-glutamine methyltransferase [Candidatus Omnitrophota bacterium]
MKDEELLLSHVLGCSFMDLYTDYRSLIPLKSRRRYEGLLFKRKRGEPLQHLTGSSEFMGLDFKVSRHTFIPRPETEILVQAVLGVINGQKGGLYLLDIGTGCGNIALTLAKFIPGLVVLATDISGLALKTARLNAKAHNLLGRAYFLNTDIFEGLFPRKSFEIIVSNPPYIANSELRYLPPEVKCEPLAALDGKEEGLFFLNKIIKEAPEYLKKDGWLALEVGWGQAGEVTKRLSSSGKFSSQRVIKDYGGIERVVIAKRR